jgi:predicted GNAT family N-acyltransferase
MTVFVEEQAVPPEEELDAYDADAVHFLARYAESEASEKIVGAARLLDRGNGVGKVGRVAVLPEHRGLGVGVLLMGCIEVTARERGFTRLDLDAQLHAIPFYEKLSYVADGDVFLDANIEHRHMSKRLD